MKKAKKLFTLLLTILLISVMSISCFASVTPGVAEVKAGDEVIVKFSYNNIAGIRGSFSFTGDEIVDKATVEVSPGFEGKYNDIKGIIAYFAAEPANFVFTLKLKISDTAVAGNEIKITLEYETTVDGNMPSVPDYKYDSVTVKIGVDYTKLNEQIAKAEALKQADYTPESWNVLKDALDKAKAAKNSSDQATVNAAANALESAIKALVKKPASVDYSKLNEQIAKAEALKQADYTSESWNVLKDALDKAKAAKNSNDQATVNAAANALESAIKALVKKPAAVDYSKLNKQIAKAEALKQADYTPESWNVLKNALDKAKAAKNSKDQATVNVAANALEKAIAGLVKKQPQAVDYTKLNEQIAKAETLNKDDYTEESWQNLQQALTNAKNAKSSKDQSVINSAATALENAIKSLVKKAATGVIDYTKLNEQIQIAENLNKDDYTSESWANLEQTLTKAKEARNATTQEEVDIATDNLKEAIKALQNKEGVKIGNNAWIFLVILLAIALFVLVIIIMKNKKKEKQ